MRFFFISKSVYYMQAEVMLTNLQVGRGIFFLLATPHPDPAPNSATPTSTWLPVRLQSAKSAKDRPMIVTAITMHTINAKREPSEMMSPLSVMVKQRRNVSGDNDAHNQR